MNVAKPTKFSTPSLLFLLPTLDYSLAARGVVSHSGISHAVSHYSVRPCVGGGGFCLDELFPRPLPPRVLSIMS